MASSTGQQSITYGTAHQIAEFQMIIFLKVTLLSLTFAQALHAQTSERGYASDQDVAILQMVAVQNGFKLKVDGKWGPKTSAILTQFSEIFDLPLNAAQMLKELNSRKLRQVYFFESAQHLEEIKKLAAYNLTDPESAKIRNVFTDGMYICGEINAKNVFGGYSGYRPFLLYVEPIPIFFVYDAIIKLIHIQNENSSKNNNDTNTQFLDDPSIQSALKSEAKAYVSNWSRVSLDIYEDSSRISSRAALLADCFYATKTLSDTEREGMLGIEIMFAE